MTLPLSLSIEARVLDAIAEVLPTPMIGCTECDPSGGCPHPFQCRLELAEKVLAVIERETAGIAA